MVKPEEGEMKVKHLLKIETAAFPCVYYELGCGNLRGSLHGQVYGPGNALG